MKLLDPNKTIFISPTAFKDCITSRGLTEFIKSYLWNRGFRNLKSFPGSDGGNGFLDSVSTLFEGEFHQIKVPSLSGPGFHAENIFIINGKNIAVIETASVIGIEKIPVDQRNPFNYTSKPLGFLIRKIQSQFSGINQIWIGIGGTATIDFGMGILDELGFQFSDESGKTLSPSLENFHLINQIEPPQNTSVELTFFYDIFISSSTREKSFFEIYGPQKGLKKDQIPILENRFFEFCKRLHLNQNVTGAGGALGLLPSKYLKTEFIKGTDFFGENEKFKNQLLSSEIIITGEGKLDDQTFQGKWISRFLQSEIPVLCITGKNETTKTLPPNWTVEELSQLESNREKSIRNAKILIRTILDKHIPESQND